MRWCEEFKGSSLDNNKWIINDNNSHNIIIENDIIRIGPEWGGIRSKDKFTFQYGYIEIRSKLASTGGENSYRSAIWMENFGQDIRGGGQDVNGGEIDMTETSSGLIRLFGNTGINTINTHIHNWRNGSRLSSRGGIYKTDFDLSQDSSSCSNGAKIWNQLSQKFLNSS